MRVRGHGAYYLLSALHYYVYIELSSRGHRASLKSRQVKSIKIVHTFSFQQAPYPTPPGAALSSASHAIHPSIRAACAESSSVPSAIVLPTPDNSKNRTKRLSHLGLASSTRTLPGFFPCHASLRDSTVGFLQWSNTWDRVILTEPAAVVGSSADPLEVLSGSPVS
jgi:hypothetical protein